ncbi:hypothetical protein JCM5353_007601 [Sporobolomyces roseus]
MPKNTPAPDFSKSHHGVSGGKNANDVYHGNRGNVMNPQSSSGSKAGSQQVMNDFSKTSAALATGYNGTKQNPQASAAAQANASTRQGDLPKWSGH